MGKHFKDHFGVILKPIDTQRVGPTPQVLEYLRQIEVVQSYHRLYVVFEKLIDQFVVILQAFLVNIVRET